MTSPPQPLEPDQQIAEILFRLVTADGLSMAGTFTPGDTQFSIYYNGNRVTVTVTQLR